MRLRESVKDPLKPVPTASPLVLDLKERLVSPAVAPPSVSGGESAVAVQLVPS
jgi:hypothetical protein